MNMIQDNLYYYGTSDELPRQLHLQAGPLSMIYEDGSLRYVQHNGVELIRMIYSAVRDPAWARVSGRIFNETITSKERSFNIEYDIEYKIAEIDFVTRHKLSGDENGNVNVNVNGTAKSSFRRNRLGICVLHPINDCAGRHCVIIQEDPETKEQKTLDLAFPERIAPNVIFTNIRTMSWQVKGLPRATISFTGDLFETEDQRNWTDSSFKTYCTPLRVPFPVTVSPGATVAQSVTLSFDKSVNALQENDESAVQMRLSISDNKKVPIPELGICHPATSVELSQEEVETLKGFGLRHYRLEVTFDSAWEEKLLKGLGTATQLGLNAELACFFSEHNFLQELGELIAVCRSNPAFRSGGNLLLFQKNVSTTPLALIEFAVPRLREVFGDVKIGAGTNNYFAEFNRNPPPNKIDFVTYSLNPQVHAFDNSSMIETLEAQAETVRSANEVTKNRPVRVSPVTLRPRFNPDASQKKPGEELPQDNENADPRQMSLFGAGWLLGSIKSLGQAGAESITYFETTGKKGLLSLQFETAPSSNLTVYPVAAVLHELSATPGQAPRILPSKSSHPLSFEGLVIETGLKTIKILLANYTSQALSIELPPFEGEFRRRDLNADILKLPDWYVRFVVTPPLSKPSAGNAGGSTGPVQTVRLEPFCACLFNNKRAGAWNLSIKQEHLEAASGSPGRGKTALSTVPGSGKWVSLPLNFKVSPSSVFVTPGLS